MLSTFVVNQVVIRNQNMYIINSFLIIMCVYYYVYNKGNGDGNTREGKSGSLVTLCNLFYGLKHLMG